MKLRTVEDLYNVMSDELAWRKKELSALKSLIQAKSLSLSKQNVILRTTITMIYAHWEGYMKACATAYLRFVSMQRLAYEELANSFIALAIRPILIEGDQSKKSENYIKIVEFFFNEMSSKNLVPYKDVVDTKSNLSSSVFENITTMLGLDYSIFATKKVLIDEKLLNSRNNIAHGNYLSLEKDEVIELYAQCLEMMEQFRTQIDNSATVGAYKSIKAIS